MKAEDIKVGMWLRWGDDAVRVTAILGDLVQVDAGNHGLHIVRPGWVEPWTPRVGEWVTVRNEHGDVRRCHPKPFRVTDLSSMVHGSMVHGNEQGGRLRHGPADLYEPCLPPAPPTTHLRADGAESPLVRELSAGVEAATETVRKQVASWSSNIGANSTCLKCGGPAYVGLQEARCLAPKCERVEPEPEVEECWVMPKAMPSPSRQKIDDADLEMAAKHREKVYTAYATGIRLVVSHPIREEAIRLWREEVARG